MFSQQLCRFSLSQYESEKFKPVCAAPHCIAQLIAPRCLALLSVYMRTYDAQVASQQRPTTQIISSKTCFQALNWLLPVETCKKSNIASQAFEPQYRQKDFKDQRLQTLPIKALLCQTILIYLRPEIGHGPDVCFTSLPSQSATDSCSKTTCLS